jgi:hypothetical protein
MNGRAWTEKEITYLERVWGIVAHSAIAKHLKRTRSAVRNKAFELGLRSDNEWMSVQEIMYKLKTTNGKVKFLLCSGNDFVRNEMSISGAQHIIDHGEQKPPEVNGYPINIDSEWHFEGEKINAPAAPPSKSGKPNKRQKEKAE